MNLTKQTDEPSTQIRWRLSNQHQLAIALLAAIAIAALGAGYGWIAWRGEQVDVDQAQRPPLTFQVDVNQAAVGELMAVPSVGPKMAEAIIEHRSLQGPFECLEQLQDVPGVGPKKLEQMRKYLVPIE